MLPDLFRTTDLLAKGLDVAQLRQETIANNIANEDTPGFKSSHVEFEDYMKAALDDSAFDTKVTRDKHIRFSGGDPSEVQPAVVQDSSTTMRMDENNVDIDQQMTDLAKNTIWYNTLVTQMNGELERLRLAIDGR